MKSSLPLRIRRFRGRQWLLGGMIFGALLAVAAVSVLAQTRWGREQILALTLRGVSGRFNGQLTVDRLDGNLLTGAKLYVFALRDPEGRPFVLADSVLVEYRLSTLLGGDIVLDRLRLFDPEIYLRKPPGDTLWNYQIILGDTVAQPDTAGGGTAFLLEDVQITSGQVTVETAWEPDSALIGAARERAVAEALSGTSTLNVRPVAGGFLRTIRLRDLFAEMSRLLVAPDEQGGTSTVVNRLAGELQLGREPLGIRRLEGSLGFQDGTLRFQLSPLVLPKSRLSGFGTIGFGDEPRPPLDVALRIDTLAFSDLGKVYGSIPEEGGAELVLVAERRDEGTVILVRDLDLRAPGTALTGEFGVLLGDTLRFLQTDLQADPLNVQTVEQLLPTELPVRGLRIGAVEIGGTTS